MTAYRYGYILAMQLPMLQKKYVTALAIGLLMSLVGGLVHTTGFLAEMELKTLDARLQYFATPQQARKDLVLVAIDETSLATIGRWPWPRDLHGYVVRYLKAAGAKAIVFDVLFPEPDRENAEYDTAFVEDVRAAGNVFMPFLMLRQLPPSATVPEEIVRQAALPMRGSSVATSAYYATLLPPLPSLAEAARGLGFIDLSSDRDGVTRRMPLVAHVHNTPVSALTLAVARQVLGVGEVVVDTDALHLGDMTLPLTASQEIVLNWHGTLEQGTYPQYTIGALLQDFRDQQDGLPPVLDATLFKDKIVFIGGTAAGTYDLRVTPLGTASPGVLTHMTMLDNLLQPPAVRVAPLWTWPLATFSLCLSTAMSVMFLRRQALKVLCSLVLLAGYYGVTMVAFRRYRLWLEFALPEIMLVLTYAVATTVEYVTEGKQRRQLRAVFDRYMAAEVVDEIMQRPEAIRLGGETREISVFFSDVAGFTTISEQLSPPALVELLNAYLTAMTDVILQHRGNVNKYLGDGIMALFGAPRGEPNHATLACYAALDCQQTLRQLQAEWQARGYPELVTRIGINSGLLVVGNMGSLKRMEYTVMGDHVNLASRLEGANKFYQTRILLGPQTYALACEDIEAREVDRLRVKGKLEPVVVYELLGRKGELSLVQQQVVASFVEGLEAYKKRHFQEALDCFMQALSLDPHDGPSSVYTLRAQEYLLSPPPGDWDGVYDLTSK